MKLTMKMKLIYKEHRFWSVNYGSDFLFAQDMVYVGQWLEHISVRLWLDIMLFGFVVQHNLGQNYEASEQQEDIRDVEKQIAM